MAGGSSKTRRSRDRWYMTSVERSPRRRFHFYVFWSFWARCCCVGPGLVVFFSLLEKGEERGKRNELNRTAHATECGETRTRRLAVTEVSADSFIRRGRAARHGEDRDRPAAGRPAGTDGSGSSAGNEAIRGRIAGQARRKKNITHLHTRHDNVVLGAREYRVERNKRYVHWSTPPGQAHSLVYPHLYLLFLSRLVAAIPLRRVGARMRVRNVNIS